MKLPCFSSNQQTEKSRTVYANDPLENAKYCDNKISNTKYTIISFLPLNLKEQFGRFMNMYFLIIACLQLWSYITPVDPASTWGPLVVIFAISAIKEAFDDYHRYVGDKKANERLCWVIRDGKRSQIQAQHILVGDIIYLESHDEIPCDVVLLSSSDEDGICYIQTANLDGETDYKTRQAISQTASIRSDQSAGEFTGIIECAAPNAEIYRFDSRVKPSRDSDEYFSLTDKQLLLQATHLKNTDWVYGVVVYTGNETKVGKNKQQPPVKWTKQDKFLNRVTIFIFCFQLTLVLVFGAVGNIWKYTYQNQMWYLHYETQPWYEIVVIPLRFLLLNSMMIPISLKVTMDVIKFFYAKIIDWDIEMYDAESDTPANAANTSISEDMGQIEYIFSDKTGTLTENRMVFKKCSINGYLYGEVETGSTLKDSGLNLALEDDQFETVEFFKTLSLCHTVVATEHNKELVYKASSPDEEALVKAAAHFGFSFKHSDSKTMKITIHDKQHIYDRLHVMEFSSDRKRMSTLLRERATGKLIMYIKGADEVILARLAPGQNIQSSQNHLEQFARIGLRTLCVAYKEVSQQEYDQWLPLYSKAQTSMEDRDRLVAEAVDLMERNFTLLGVSAIEDQLQEKVPETIQALRDAGIKIWMLTGDKFSTAVQIATSCNLISSIDALDQLVVLKGPSSEEMLKSIQNGQSRATQLTTQSRQYTVIIEGKDLNVALERSSDFLRLCLGAGSVICCRVTPQQKAQVVKLVKDADHMTLAIGDGGNDVVMIQEAHIGIGIAGREGLQAARAADYSVGKFRFLKRLLLIHGRYHYLRTSFVAQYCFYKSLFICFIQIMYCFFTGFSGTSFFNTFSLTTYNMLFTSIAPVLYVLDKDLPENTVWNNPQLYQDSQQGSGLNVKTFVLWTARALFQAFIVFAITILGYTVYDGSTMEYTTISMVTYTSVIFVNALTVAFESNNLTIVNHVGIWGSVVSYFILMTILSAIPSSSMYYIMFVLYSQASYWFIVILSVFAALLPVHSIKLLFTSPKNILHNESIRLDQYGITIHDKTPLLSSEL